MRLLRIAGLFALVIGCRPLWVLGVEEDVSQKSGLEEPPPIDDDRIEDKHPVYDPTLVTTEEFGEYARCTVTLNKSASVTKLDVVPYDEASKGLEGKIFRGWGDAVQSIGGAKILPSMELVQALMKPFNDGLYAAVELDAEIGVNAALLDKRALFRDVLSSLVKSGTTTDGAAMFAGALKIAGESPTAPSPVLGRADALTAAFDALPLASRPIGFYTWSADLSAIFRHDRFLQAFWSATPTFEDSRQIALSIRGDTALRARYRGIVDLYAGLTGPYRDPSPLALADLMDEGAPTDAAGLRAAAIAKFPDLAKDGSCGAVNGILPRSQTAETRLFHRLFCDEGANPATNTLDLLIAQIRSGKLDLTPTATAGWSDRQLYALETLLVPERAEEKDHLFLTRRYKEKLVETFKTIVTQNSETHVKQTETVSDATSAGPIEFDLHPNLPVEPFPTFYVRTARAYAFVENLLRSTMGSEWMSTAHRVREDGTRARATIGEELSNMKSLLYGLYVVSAKSIGLRPNLAPDEGIVLDDVEKRARDFAEKYASEPDLGSDPRVIVPMLIDDVNVHYWAVIGVQALPMKAEFYPGLEPRDVHSSCVVRNVVPQERFVLTGKTVEIVLPNSRPPPTRDELRAACDASTNVDDIRHALGAP